MEDPSLRPRCSSLTSNIQTKATIHVLSRICTVQTVLSSLLTQSVLVRNIGIFQFIRSFWITNFLKQMYLHTLRKKVGINIFFNFANCIKIKFQITENWQRLGVRVDAFRRQNIPLDYFSNSKCAQIFSTIQIIKRNFGDSFKAMQNPVGFLKNLF